MKYPAQDKLLHFTVGTVIMTLTIVLQSILLSVIVLLAVSFGKEAYDYFNKDSHTPELNDALYTIAGGTVSLFAYYLGQL